jgi:hypothetical protein
VDVLNGVLIDGAVGVAMPQAMLDRVTAAAIRNVPIRIFHSS